MNKKSQKPYEIYLLETHRKRYEKYINAHHRGLKPKLMKLYDALINDKVILKIESHSYA